MPCGSLVEGTRPLCLLDDLDKEQPSIRSVEDKEHRDLLNTSSCMVKRPFYHNAVHGPCLSMREEHIFILRPVISKSSPR